MTTTKQMIADAFSKAFNKYFYKPTPLRSLEENERDILALDEKSQGFIRSLFETTEL